MKVIGIAGWSGAGKTTLISRVIPYLRQQGLRVSVIKHAHHDFDVDVPGKDSWVHRQSGAAEVLVSSASTASTGDDDAFVWSREIMDELAGDVIENERADGYLEGHVIAIASGAVAAFAVAAALGLVLRIEAEVHERVVALARLHEDVATASAVTAAGPAAGNELLAPERHASVAAVASLYADSCLINEH